MKMKDIAIIHDALDKEYTKLKSIYQNADNELDGAQGTSFDLLRERVNKLDIATDALRECLATLRSI